MVAGGKESGIVLYRAAFARHCSSRDAAPENLTVLRLPEGANGLAAAVIEIVPLQLLTARLAAERGQDALDFRYRQTGTKIEA